MASGAARPAIAVFNENGILLRAIEQVFAAEGFPVIVAPASAFDGPYALLDFCREHQARVLIFDISQPYEGSWRAFQAVHGAAKDEGFGMIVTCIDRWGLVGRPVPEDVVEI